MGSVCDLNDLERFLRSSEGQAHLEETRQMLLGHTIRDVTFENEVHSITTTLHLDDGETFDVFQPSLEVDVIREEFAEVLDREYYIDFPNRKPADEDPA